MTTTNKTQTQRNYEAWRQIEAERATAKAEAEILIQALSTAYSKRADLNDSYQTLCSLQNSCTRGGEMWDSFEAAKTHMWTLIDAKSEEIGDLLTKANGNQEILDQVQDNCDRNGWNS